jgi:Inner membrane protein YgaP-like, transmembrane domain
MSVNEGTVDRVLRVLVGLLLIALVFVGPRTNWGWIGLVPLITGLVGVCPLYRLVGFSTCSKA